MRHTYFYAILFFILFAAFSCVVDEPIGGGGTTKEEKETNRWIYDKLTDYYLWYEEMPDENSAKFDYEPETFFYSLLNEKDGKTYSNGSRYYYSTISPKSNTKTKSYQGDSPSFGFEYQAWQDSKTKFIGLQILYVLPNSPASKAKLKRGDWILKINNKDVGNDYYDLIKESDGLKFGIGTHFANNLTLTDVDLLKEDVEDNPVFVSKVVNGKVGYLAYNHFTTGPGGTSDTSFDQDMVNAVKELATSRVTEFVLDLRYNGGGYVTSAQKLASALAPSSAINEIFCKLTMNDKHPKENSSMKLLSEYHSGLNLSRLFVITSSRTASASELVIAGLQPYMDVILVGEKTEGKDVGSREFEDDEYDWKLQPIICYVTNSRGDNYSDGLPVKHVYDYSEEAKLSSTEIFDLGEPQEKVLKMILDIINPSTPNSPLKAKGLINKEDNLNPLASSLDEKKKNSVLLN